MPTTLRRASLMAGFLLGGLLVFRVAAGEAPQAAERPDFEKDVLPIFRSKCLNCHGETRQKAGLDLRSKAALLSGGESGPALTPGSAEKSLLWEMVHQDRMPPKGKEKLTAGEKATLKAWIERGAAGGGTAATTPAGSDRQVTAEDRQFWAFQPPMRPAVPAVKNRGRVRNPIDAFVLAALEKKGLTLSPEAERRQLNRRLSFDLIGLPPTAEDVEAFVSDRSADAYEKVVDRLLASKHYGERWARHWLDLAGYADSEGILDEDRVRTAAWRYRDYVIDAFNQDKPYDRFLKEQIAGDELVEYWKVHQTEKELNPAVVQALVATGYLRCASDASRPDFVNIKNAPGYYYQTLDDTVKIVSSSLLGLTLHCARCHSHKYDPIPQTDYYRMQAIFMGAYRPGQWVAQANRRLNEATAVQEKRAQEHNQQIDKGLAELKKQEQALLRQFGDRLYEERLKAIPAAIREDVRTALATAPAKRTVVQKYLADKLQPELRPAAAVLNKALAERFPEFKEKHAALTRSMQAKVAEKITFPEIRALYDLPGAVKTPLLRRGEYTQPGPEVQPGALTVLATPKPFRWQPPPADAKSSGRRLALAEWVAQPGHPLTARVQVNRLWLHHFGEGLVSTPENFGRTGSAPSHPELLDWLATEFEARGWSIKAMHRLIVTSSAYRQAAAAPADHPGQLLDPENRLLWRQRLRRLDAEALRDSVLSVSGRLNAQIHGPPVPVRRNAEGEVSVADDPQGWRRSIYLQVRRSQPVTFLQLFDQPVVETNCTRRQSSTVASQALTLLHSDFMVRQAEACAARVTRANSENSAGYAVALLFGRPASAAERERFQRFLSEQTEHHRAGKAGLSEESARQRALADLCQVLMSANEFLYVE